MRRQNLLTFYLVEKLHVKYFINSELQTNKHLSP